LPRAFDILLKQKFPTVKYFISLGLEGDLGQVGESIVIEASCLDNYGSAQIRTKIYATGAICILIFLPNQNNINFCGKVNTFSCRKRKILILFDVSHYKVVPQCSFLHYS
jgi:hypothetical protein